MMLSGQALAMTLGPVDRPRWWRAGAAGPIRCEATCQEAIVSQVRVHNFSVSLDGFGTGAGQSLEAPFGHAGTRLHEWFFPARSFRSMQGQPGGSTGIDDVFASAWCWESALRSWSRPAPGQSSLSQAWPASGLAIDVFLQQLASTRRFTLGVPRAVTVSRDGGQVLFLRTRGGEDPVICL
jgi:hypothetical protein